MALRTSTVFEEYDWAMDTSGPYNKIYHKQTMKMSYLIEIFVVGVPPWKTARRRPLPQRRRRRPCFDDSRDLVPETLYEGVILYKAGDWLIKSVVRRYPGHGWGCLLPAAAVQ